MCEFYSCIVTKTGKVLDSDISDSHEDIITENNLKDDKIINRTWCRIEVTPKDNNYGLSLENWEYRIDENSTIDWHTDKHKKAVLLALKKQIDNNCIINKTVKEIKNQKIKIMYNSTISEMRGNSTVSEMRDNSTVSEMRDNSTVSEMWDNSTISEMRDNSTISEMLSMYSFVRTYNNNIKNHKRGLVMDLSKNRKIIDKMLTVKND